MSFSTFHKKMNKICISNKDLVDNIYKERRKSLEMKSYCIKTDSKQMIEYLLNKISNLNFPNIYYCNKSFKIYENVIVHYKEKNVEKFKNIIANIITDTEIEFYQEKITKRILNVNYFYFEEFEKNIIYENCIEFLKQDEEEVYETLFKCIKKNIDDHKNIYLEGIINFRVGDYVKILDNIVDMAVNKYIIEKEYNEFISLLRIYVNTSEPKTELIHLIYTNGESILLDKEKNIIKLNNEISNAKYLSDITFSSNDIALNTLLSMLPKKIELHIIDKEDEFINTLKLIFENKIRICIDCNICKTYRMINKVNLSYNSQT